VAGPEAKETIMTAGERLIQQGEARGLEQGIRRGLEQGLEQGIRRGLEQGIQQGEKAILLRMLRNRFGNLVDETVERRVEAASAEEVAAWADRWMSATTLAELLAG
jgi:flagellar biosynthesis/type III secretory pathway protein FliH